MSALIEIDDLRKTYRTGLFGRGGIEALRGVSLRAQPGTTTAVVGESGSGKSTLARAILGLTRPTSGTVRIGPHVLEAHRSVTARTLYRTVQLVFQDPYSSLNPRRTVAQTLDESLRHFTELDGSHRRERTVQLLDTVRLGAEHLARFPHQLSGGQRQRVGIARALAAEPQVLVLDEPTSSLDVSVRLHIIELLRELQQHLDLTYLFISHDLGVVDYLADQVYVLQRGLVVESGDRQRILRAPETAYTRALLDAAPVPAWESRNLMRKPPQPPTRNDTRE